MVITVQHVLDGLKAEEYAYHGKISHKKNNIHFAVLSYDMSAVRLCGSRDALFVIPPDGFFLGGAWTKVLTERNVCPAALIVFVKADVLKKVTCNEPLKFPVIFVGYHSRQDAKEYYRKIDSLLRLSGNEEILYRGITTGLLWGEQKYERNDIIFLCKLLKLKNEGPYRVFIVKNEPQKQQMLIRIKEALSAKYQIRTVVIRQNFLAGILSGELTERTQMKKLCRSITEDIGFEMKVSLSSLKWSLEELHSGLQEALRTYDLVGILKHTDKNLLGYDELGIYQVLFELNDSKKFDEYCDSVFRKLWDYDRENNASLFQTLESYFSNEFDIKKTAADLFIHTNTLRYRINQIENIMERDLKNLHDITEIETAFMVRTMSNVIF